VIQGGKPFLIAVLADWHADRVSMIQEINERPLYPSEEVRVEGSKEGSKEGRKGGVSVSTNKVT
jgi:hypothetical protein